MKTLTKTSHIAKVRQQDQIQMQRICEILMWSEVEYCNHQFEEYTNFLTRMFFGFPEAMLKQVMHSKVMRGFWNNEWTYRNQVEFLPFADEMTEDVTEVDPSGELVYMPKTEHGDAGLVGEYMFIHGYRALMQDELFMFRYNNILELVRSRGAIQC
ncbi:MAG: hypothetical protein ACO1NU_08595 [Arcticibacter sp.]